ncbi:MAG: T9SS type A sorting domain-containing protein [Candidatus Stahlbacteria bacterium]|nr:MAG: T9SS type A sorting domain-containing protein [Candidatus Stahlbacteria bacterium]
MKLLSLFLIVACLGAADIHKLNVVTPCEVLAHDNATIISFSNGIVFDTRNGEPDLPDNLSIDRYYGAGYYMIQLKGPIYQTWTEDLKSSGIEIFAYIPHYAFLIFANDEQVRDIKTKSFVNWVGLFQPAYKLQKDLFNARGVGRVTIQLFPNEDISNIAAQILEMGFDINEIIDHTLCKTIDVFIDLERVSDIANIPGVLWIQSWSEPSLCNDNCQWVMQTGQQSSIPPDSIGRRIWHEGIVGDGIVLSTTDSGIITNHLQYYDSSNPITGPGVFPTHRKIVAYKLYSGAVFSDHMSFGYHGTHVNCTVAGNDTLLGSSNYDGMVKHAKIYFVDIASLSGLVVSSNLTSMYDTIYPGIGLGYNILQHSGSWGWGNSSGTYLIQDASTDAYVWANRDFLNLYAAGNESSSMRLRNPGISKNILTVGATLNGTNSNQIAAFSSRGPTQDNRIKPNLMTPGDGVTAYTGLWSADGSTYTGYIRYWGTSMATPAANGAIGLIRQYLLAGFYPTGAADPADSIKYQSAALLRAMAIVSCDPNVGSWSVPDFNIGWGRLDADSVLYFAGDIRKLIIKDDTLGLTTGYYISDSFYVNSAIPLRVCVAWTDTAAAPNANPTLVNDLNVELFAPSGTYYHGNIYSAGQSVANPSTWDDNNVEECCRINSPETGFWHIVITGQSIPYGPQPFAYAITGDISFTIGIEEYERTITPGSQINFFNSITKDKLNLEIVLNSSADVHGRIFDLTGRVVHEIINKRLAQGVHRIEQSIDLTSGVYFVEIKTDELHEIKKILVVR